MNKRSFKKESRKREKRKCGKMNEMKGGSDRRCSWKRE
jgi:hypothetical protein